MLSGNIMMTITSLAFIYALFTLRKEIKKAFQRLPFIQLTSIGLSFVVIVAFATFLIYYVGNYFLGFIHIRALQIIAQYVIIISVIGFSLFVLHIAFKKISQGFR